MTPRAHGGAAIFFLDLPWSFFHESYCCDADAGGLLCWLRSRQSRTPCVCDSRPLAGFPSAKEPFVGPSEASDFPYSDMLVSFPLPFPDLDAAAEAEKIVLVYGLRPVVIALEREYCDASPPRNVRALCLISLLDKSDRWLTLWKADKPLTHGENIKTP